MSDEIWLYRVLRNVRVLFSQEQFRPLLSVTLSLSHAYVHTRTYTYKEYKKITTTLTVIIYISLNYG